MPTTNRPIDSASCACFAAPLNDILRELRAVLAGITPDEYTRPMGPAYANATIGGHVRHSLDHARAVVEGRASGLVDYDHRARGTDIESSPAAADAELARLTAAIDDIGQASAAEELAVALMPTREGQAVRCASSLSRELAFVLSHTIHHNATLRGMILALGRPVPASLGYAPATLAHQDSRACAR